MGTVKAVCTSDRKGIQKLPHEAVELKPDWGIVGDAHAGQWHRQVSLLSFESIEDFKARGAQDSAHAGAFLTHGRTRGISFDAGNVHATQVLARIPAAPYPPARHPPSHRPFARTAGHDTPGRPQGRAGRTRPGSPTAPRPRSPPGRPGSQPSQQTTR